MSECALVRLPPLTTRGSDVRRRPSAPEHGMEESRAVARVLVLADGESPGVASRASVLLLYEDARAVPTGARAARGRSAMGLDERYGFHSASALIALAMPRSLGSAHRSRSDSGVHEPTGTSETPISTMPLTPLATSGASSSVACFHSRLQGATGTAAIVLALLTGFRRHSSPGAALTASTDISVITTPDGQRVLLRQSRRPLVRAARRAPPSADAALRSARGCGDTMTSEASS